MMYVLEEMLKRYDIQTSYDKRNAMKEIMQELVLCGLSRAGFFKRAAFYGGTALRIFYGLDRFSDDLDFSLTATDKAFRLEPYFPTLEKEIASYGLHVSISEKEKSKDSDIRSAFLKGSTKEHLLLFYADEALAKTIPSSEVVKIKFEVDVNPPQYACFEHRYRLLPAPYEIALYDAPSLFAGKIHAVLCRSWKSRIKGRDLYDYVFYLSRSISVNLKHLRERLLQSEFITSESPCSLSDIKKLLNKRFDEIDYFQAKQDVLPFIRDDSLLNLWSPDFFKQITDNLTASD